MEQTKIKKEYELKEGQREYTSILTCQQIRGEGWLRITSNEWELVDNGLENMKCRLVRSGE